MANWDHRNNIGTHPMLSTDRREALLTQIEAAAYQAARHQQKVDQLRDELAKLPDDGTGFHGLHTTLRGRAAVSAGRARAIKRLEEETGAVASTVQFRSTAAQS